MLALRTSRILVRRTPFASGLTKNVRTLSTSPAAASDGKPTSSAQEQVDKAKLERLSKEFMSLNLSETIAFIDMMQKLLGLGDVRAMVSAGAAAPAAAGAGKAAESAKKEAAPAAAAKSSFELKLESFEAGDKIKVIKAVREITGLGLKEAKDLVEGAPKVVMKDIAKAQGDQLIEKLKAAGAKASLV